MVLLINGAFPFEFNKWYLNMTYFYRWKTAVETDHIDLVFLHKFNKRILSLSGWTIWFIILNFWIDLHIIYFSAHKIKIKFDRNYFNLIYKIW